MMAATVASRQAATVAAKAANEAEAAAARHAIEPALNGTPGPVTRRRLHLEAPISLQTILLDRVAPAKKMTPKKKQLGKKIKWRPHESQPTENLMHHFAYFVSKLMNESV